MTASPHNSEELEDSIFRRLLVGLDEPRGDTPDWPRVLLPLLQREYLARRLQRVSYSGSRLFVDRDDKDHTTAAEGTEKAAVRTLFQLCREQSDACLNVGGVAYWLLSYEVPCFGDRRRQCADLVGLSVTGGLVVFECKLNNSYAPLTALIEGLDYLSCLTAEPNFGRFREEFEAWREKADQVIPSGFEEVTPCSSAAHEVVVLGSPAYYSPYRRSSRGEGWPHLAAYCRDWSDALRFGLAQTEFDSTSASWVTA